jgi:hypothetical protein
VRAAVTKYHKLGRLCTTIIPSYAGGMAEMVEHQVPWVQTPLQQKRKKKRRKMLSSHSVRGWDVQGQGAVCWVLAVHRWLLVTSPGRRSKGVFWGLLFINLFKGIYVLSWGTSQDPPPNTITLGIKFQNTVGEGTKHSVFHTSQQCLIEGLWSGSSGRVPA